MSSIRSLARMSSSRLLSVTPSSSLIDSKVNITAAGLEGNSPVTLRSVSEQETRRGIVRFEGHAHYIADDRGVVSVPEQTSLGGTYTGAEPMGLFWSMLPAPDQPLGVRYMVKDVTKPMIVNLSLYKGHLDTDTLQTAEPEARATAEKWYMGKDVERIKVHSGRLRGTLFKPKGSGPFPGVIDLFGSAGGLLEIRAAMLASHGLACYALPYFNYEDLPPRMWEIELEYFKEAIDWLCDQPFVKPGGVGIVGVSTGAQISLATAAHFPEKVRAVVSINGCHVQTLFPLKLNGELLPYVEFEFGNIKQSAVEGAKILFDAYQDVYDLTQDSDTVYKLEKAPNCSFLFVVGEDDRNWDSSYFAEEAMKRLKRYGCHNHQLLSYPDGGHLLEIPYAPVGIAVFSPGLGDVSDHGGTVAGTAKAMEDSWPKIVRFLHNHCGRTNSKL